MSAHPLTWLLPPPTTRPRPLPALAAAALALLVLAVHAGLLLPPSAAPQRGPATGVQVRTIRIGPETPTAAEAPSPRAWAPAATGATTQPSPAARQPAPAASAVVAAALPAADPNEEDVAAPSAPLVLGELGAWPVYATALPEPVTLRYAWRRGGQQGRAELRFERDGAGYRLSLQQQADGRPRQGSTSEGRIDANGLAPERLADQRKDRELRAANFRRDQGRITFSGPSTEAPLLEGSQDRLSWLLQLAGILQANPALAQPGRQVQLFVAGTRGDAEVWRCDVIGREDLDLPAGPVRGALHLRRTATRPHDLTVDIWVDPARQHLPVRLWQRLNPQGPGSEWLLVDAQGSPRP